MTRHEKVREVIALIGKVYEFSLSGGNAHTVLDDENTENHNIRWCLDETIPENAFRAPPRQIAAERACLNAMLELTEDERDLALRAFNRQHNAR
jgi:hypothetical protein